MQGVLGPQRQQQSALWLAGTLLALALHGGLAAWWMRMPSAESATATPPAAIMIEVAEMPQAAQTQQNNITPEKKDSQASRAQNRQEAPSDSAAAPVEKPLPDPVKTAEKTLPEVKKAAVTRPVPRSSRQKENQRREQQKKPHQHKPQQEQQRELTASAQSIQAQVRAMPSQHNAARQTVASSTLSPQQQATWMSRVMAHLERRKRYPEAAQDRGQQGVVTVEFTLDGEGNVLTVRLKKSAGFSSLDNEVLSLLRRASPLPAPPDGVQKRLIVPVQFFPRM